MQSGLLVPTPLLLLNGQVFLWDVPPLSGLDTKWSGWTKEAFKVFEVVTPKPGALPLTYSLLPKQAEQEHRDDCTWIGEVDDPACASFEDLPARFGLSARSAGYSALTASAFFCADLLRHLSTETSSGGVQYVCGRGKICGGCSLASQCCLGADRRSCRCMITFPLSANLRPL